MPLVPANLVFFDLFEFLGVRVARRFEPPTVTFEEPSSPVMADRSTRDAIHVELPSFNPFAAEEPRRRGAYRSRLDDEEFAPSSDDGGIVVLPAGNPFAAPDPSSRRRNNPAQREIRPRGGRRGLVHTQGSPGRDEEEPFDEQAESDGDSDLAPPPRIGRRTRADISVGGEEREIIKDYAPPSPPRRVDSSSSEEEDERVVISSAVGAQDSEPASDGERPTVQLSSENPFGPPAVQSRLRGPVYNKNVRPERVSSYIDDQGVIHVELPTFNPFGPEPESRRRSARRTPSIEDLEPVDFPVTNPSGHRGENPFAR